MAADRLLNHVNHWTPTRWAKPTRSGDTTRAAAVHALIQQLADLTATACHGPLHQVPRLANDLALPDQLRVVVADLRRAPATPETLATATTRITTTASTL